MVNHLCWLCCHLQTPDSSCHTLKVTLQLLDCRSQLISDIFTAARVTIHMTPVCNLGRYYGVCLLWWVAGEGYLSCQTAGVFHHWYCVTIQTGCNITFKCQLQWNKHIWYHKYPKTADSSLKILRVKCAVDTVTVALSILDKSAVKLNFMNFYFSWLTPQGNDNLRNTVCTHSLNQELVLLVPPVV